MRQSGSEPVFDPECCPVIGNNCYDYAFGDCEDYRPHRSEPGEHARIESATNWSKCYDMKARILADNPGKVYVPETPDTCCQPGYYKVMAFVAPEGDFHFYKHIGSVLYKMAKGDTIKGLAEFFRTKPEIVRKFLKNHKPIPVNLWAHKRGWATPPLIYDASQKTITDPRKANRSYDMHYDTHCGTYCVKVRGVRTGPPLGAHPPGFRQVQSRK